ncbi:unnamed protein product [Arctogadus glacialis]
MEQLHLLSSVPFPPRHSPILGTADQARLRHSTTPNSGKYNFKFPEGQRVCGQMTLPRAQPIFGNTGPQ